MIRTQQTPIQYRSVSEQRYATLMMLKEGQWDGKGRTYRTHETQLQEVSQHFAERHKQLRVSHALLYEREGRDPDAVYPQCPRQLLHEYHVKAEKLGEVDPAPSKVKHVAQQIALRKTTAMRKAQQQQQQQQGGGARRGSGSYHDDSDATPLHPGEEDENDGDEDGSGPTASSSAASADARSQFELELLRAASRLGVNSPEGVDTVVLSPSKYARPSTFTSGSHAPRPQRDQSFIFSPASVVGRGGGRNGSTANDGDGEDDDDASFGTGSSRAGAGGGRRRAGPRATRGSGGNGDDEGFFLTDMGIADDGVARDEDEAEELRVQSEMQQSFRNAAAAAASRTGAGGGGTGASGATPPSSRMPVLPPISGARKTPQAQQCRTAEQFLTGARANANPYRVSPARSIGSRASPKAVNVHDSSVGAAMTPSKYVYVNRNREPVYSSLLTELRSTRAQVEEEARKCSTLQAIANLGGTPEFRRTVTRIFANPEEGERISDDEMKRRQKLYEKLSKQQREVEMNEESTVFGGGANNNNNSNSTSSGQFGKRGDVPASAQDAVAAFERDLAMAASKLASPGL
jgi:hypothetical protein